MGIAAVVYMTNPRPDGVFSSRLAPDTLVLDCKLSDRQQLPSDVVDLYEPSNSTNPGILITLPRTRTGTSLFCTMLDYGGSPQAPPPWPAPSW